MRSRQIIHGAILVSLAVEAVIAAYLIVSAWSTTELIGRPHEDLQWAVYELGLENHKLVSAFEAQKPPDVVLLRGNIFLSRILLLFHSNAYSMLTALVPKDELAHVMDYGEELGEAIAVAEVGKDPGLVQLRQLVMDNSAKISALSIEMSTMARLYAANERQNRASYLQMVFVLLAFVIASLGAIAFATIALNRRLAYQTSIARARAAESTTILETTRDVIIGFDSSEKVLLWNPAAEARFGHPKSFAVGRPLEELVGPRIATELRGDRPGPEGGDLVIGDGGQAEERQVFSVARHSYRGMVEGKHTQVTILSLRDITRALSDRLDFEERRRKIREIVQKRAAAALASRIIHEINQPIAAIKNYCFIARHYAPAQRTERNYEQVIERAAAEVDRLAQITSSMRKFDSFQERMLQKVDLKTILKNAITEAQAVFGVTVVLGELPEDRLNISAADSDLYDTVMTMISLVSESILTQGAAKEVGIHLTQLDGSCKLFVGQHPANPDFEAGTSEIPFEELAMQNRLFGVMILKRLAEQFGGHLSWWLNERSELSFELRLLVKAKEESREYVS